MKIADIKVGENVRKGEQTARPSLVASMGDPEIGQLQPIGVTKDNVLVFGFNRLLAAQELGWTDIDTVEVAVPNGSRIAIQVAENTQREDLTNWELTQAAWDLKQEGMKQAEVADALLISKKDVSRLHKMAKVINADEDIDDNVLNLFSFEELEQLAVEPDGEYKPAVSDVLRLYMEQDGDTYRGRDVRDAQRDAVVELKAAAWLDEIADTLSMLNEKGVKIVDQNPLKFTDRGGNVRNVAGTAEIGKEPKNPGYQAPNYLNVPLDTHVLEECHRVYVTQVTNMYTDPVLIHCCVDTSRHAPSGESKLRAKKAGTTAGTSPDEKAQASADRRAAKLATEKRFVQAGIWLNSVKVAETVENAYRLAVSTVRSDDYRQFNRILGIASERPKGADFNWHKERFNKWLKDEGCTEVQAQRVIVNLLTIKPWCVGSQFGTFERGDEWAAIEVPDGD